MTRSESFDCVGAKACFERLILKTIDLRRLEAELSRQRQELPECIIKFLGLIAP